MVSSVSSPGLSSNNAAYPQYGQSNPYPNPSYYAPNDYTNGFRPQISRDTLYQWFDRNKNPNNQQYYEPAYGPDGISNNELSLIQNRAGNQGDTESLDSRLSTSLLGYGFGKADTDKSGNLSTNEIFAARGAVTIEQGNTMTQTQAQISSMFKTFSGQVSDGKGITMQDLDTLTKSGLNNGYQTPVASLLKRNFNAFDANKDGNISYNEMITAKFQDGPKIGQNLFNISG